jgi:hypothetical protein
MTIAPSLTVADILVTDLAEGQRTETETVARLHREGLCTDRDALAEACRAFQSPSAERYDRALRVLAGVA